MISKLKEVGRVRGCHGGEVKGWHGGQTQGGVAPCLKHHGLQTGMGPFQEDPGEPSDRAVLGKR